MLPPAEFLAAMRTDPASPENYWVYFMVLSTMIPSALNLGLGGMAWLRGNAGLRRWALARLPADKAVGMATKVNVGLAVAGWNLPGRWFGVG